MTQFVIFMNSNKKIYEPLVLNLHPYQLKIDYSTQNTLVFMVKNQLTSLEKESILTDHGLPLDLQRCFAKLEEIYQYFHNLAKQDGQGQKRCVIDDEKIALKIPKQQHHNGCSGEEVYIKLNPKKAELTPYQKLKRGIILQQLNSQLNTFRHSKMLRAKTDFSLKSVIPIEQAREKEDPVQNMRASQNNHDDCRWEISRLTSRLDSMNHVLKEHSQKIEAIQSTVLVNGLQKVLSGYQTKQDSILQKLMKVGHEITKLRLDKKQTAKKFEEQASGMWGQISRVREMIKTTAFTQFNLGDVAVERLNSSLLSDFNRQLESSIKSREMRQGTQNSAAISLKDRPIEFIRRETGQSTVFMPNASFMLTQDEIQQFKAGVEDQSIFRKKIRQLQKKIYSALPPAQIFLKFQKSKFASEYTMTTEKQATLIVKKGVDKKCQLVGQPLPKAGKVYFDIELIQVPNGYIHLGVVSADMIDQVSSHDSRNGVNYFGGNGSVNDKGNGIFIGKQLKDGDVVSVLVDSDLKKVLFILRGQVLSEVSLKGLSLDKGLLPYLQFFYSGSKVKVCQK